MEGRLPRLCGCRRRCASIGRAEKETDIAASQEEEEDRAKKSERRSFPILETNSRTDRIPSIPTASRDVLETPRG